MRRRRPAGPRWLRLWRQRLGWVLIIVVLGPALVDGGIAAMHSSAAGADQCRVVRVVDGDTVTLWCSAGGITRARLVGFDAPELFSPQCLGEVVAAQQAKWALRAILLGAADLRLQPEGRDRYGRLLVRVSDGEVPVAGRMIAAGHGRAYGGGRRDGWCAGE
jgi:micrococcal nuclease